MLANAMVGRKIRQPHLKIQPTGVVARGSTDMVAVEDALVKAAVQFIRAQAGRLIGVEQVAQAVAVSRRTLDRRFAEVLGRTVHAELARVRMQMARGLLAQAADGLRKRGAGVVILGCTEIPIVVEDGDDVVDATRALAQASVNFLTAAA